MFLVVSIGKNTRLWSTFRWPRFIWRDCIDYAADLLGFSLPWGRLRGGTGGAKMLPTWADRNGRASLVPLSRLQLLGAAGTAEGLKQI